mmetsp:Transcript_28535/g.42600  ORF Transcript_28535/g.42600 Transcript_28535/m.42600 type:complete len:92 (-) Transcript_28535:1922-2197(-)
MSTNTSTSLIILYELYAAPAWKSTNPCQHFDKGTVVISVEGLFPNEDHTWDILDSPKGAGHPLEPRHGQYTAYSTAVLQDDGGSLHRHRQM